MSTSTRKPYEFTLTLDGAEELTFEMMDRLFEAGCADATFGTRCGVHCTTFHREADSPLEAILAAIDAVEGAGVGLWVVRVEPDELVTTGEIAARAGLSREAVRLYAQGKRGPGGFPAPVGGLQQKSPLFRWSDVAAWLVRVRGEARQLDTSEADAIAFLNAALDMRRLAPVIPDAEAAFRRLQKRSKPRARTPTRMSPTSDAPHTTAAEDLGPGVV